MARVARYDGFADWYDQFATSEAGLRAGRIAMELLGPGTGRLLDVGCGTGAHTVGFVELGWTATGIDVSEDQLRLARERGVDVVLGDAERLPFDAGSFDAAVSMWTHTDVMDFAAVAREVARVLRAGAPFAYLGAHPCFVGPHSRFIGAEGVPTLFDGYRRAGRYEDGPGVTPEGVRARVGATHVPLGPLVQAFVDAGFLLERFGEPEVREYPYMLAMRWRR